MSHELGSSTPLFLEVVVRSPPMNPHQRRKGKGRQKESCHTDGVAASETTFRLQDSFHGRKDKQKHPSSIHPHVCTREVAGSGRTPGDNGLIYFLGIEDSERKSGMGGVYRSFFIAISIDFRIGDCTMN